MYGENSSMSWISVFYSKICGWTHNTCSTYYGATHMTGVGVRQPPAAIPGGGRSLAQVRWLVAGCLGPAHGGPAPPPPASVSGSPRRCRRHSVGETALADSSGVAIRRREESARVPVAGGWFSSASATKALHVRLSYVILWALRKYWNNYMGTFDLPFYYRAGTTLKMNIVWYDDHWEPHSLTPFTSNFEASSALRSSTEAARGPSPWVMAFTSSSLPTKPPSRNRNCKKIQLKKNQ